MTGQHVAAASTGLTIDQVAMDGAHSVVEGRTRWRRPPRQALLCLPKADGPDALLADLLQGASSGLQGASSGQIFSVRIPLDLTRTALTVLRLRCEWEPGQWSEETLPQPAQFKLDGLVGDRSNGLHLRQCLRERGVAMPEARMVLDQFESLGDNCEFGIYAQARGAGASRPSLFRFGGTSEFKTTPRSPPGRLSNAISDYFEGLDDPADINLHHHGGMDEWIVISRRYGFMFHSGARGEMMESDKLVVQLARRLRLAVSAFVELATDPDIIFVRKSNGHETEADMLTHLGALRELGPARLLWVDLAAPATQADQVTLYPGGLLRTRIAQFAHYDDAGRPDLDAWDRVIEATWYALEGVAAVQGL